MLSLSLFYVSFSHINDKNFTDYSKVMFTPYLPAVPPAPGTRLNDSQDNAGTVPLPACRSGVLISGHVLC